MTRKCYFAFTSMPSSGDTNSFRNQHLDKIILTSYVSYSSSSLTGIPLLVLINHREASPLKLPRTPDFKLITLSRVLKKYYLRKARFETRLDIA